MLQALQVQWMIITVWHGSLIEEAIPAVTLPNDFELHFSLSVTGSVATFGSTSAESGVGGEKRREVVLVDWGEWEIWNLDKSSQI